jgi:hypothetical protein
MRRLRRLVCASFVVASFCGALMSAPPAFADPSPTQPQRQPKDPGLGELLSHPDEWLTTMFNNALAEVGRRTTGDVAGFLDWLIGGNANIITRTPPEMSYANKAIAELSNKLVMVANGGLVAIVAVGGVNVIVRPHLREPYHGAMELAPRLILGAIMVNTSLQLGQFAIDLNNAICDFIGKTSLPGWPDVKHLPDGGTLLLNLLAAGIYLVMGMLLTGQMMMRLALVDALLVVAPLALLCWILPQTYGWARLWFSTFFGTVFVQAIQVLVLRLGVDLIGQLPQMLGSFNSNPADAARTWLTTLFVGMAVLQLARKIPRLMPGVPPGLGPAYSGVNVVRQITSVFNGGDNKKRGK